MTAATVPLLVAAGMLVAFAAWQWLAAGTLLGLAARRRAAAMFRAASAGAMLLGGVAVVMELAR